MPKTVEINGRKVGEGQPVFIIGEIGINHNGDIDIAKKLIDAAVLAGCDAVKFQKRTPELCVPEEQKNMMRETQWGMMTYMDYRHSVEFGKNEYQEINNYCREKKIFWFASCWDEPSVEFIEQFDPVCFKIASASLTGDALLKYSHHLRYGLINPKEIFSDTYFLPYDDSSKGDLLEPLRQENLTEYFNSIQPKSKRYLKLQEALKYYEKFIGKDWPQINLTVNKIEYGDINSAVPLIIDKLITLGYLDTSKVKISNPSFYDSLKFKCIQLFQRDNGLNDDGVIGKNTVVRLNFTPEQYVNTIKVNLERFRWNNYQDTSYVLVNIPDFRLFIFDNGVKIFESKVCTGSKRPGNFDARMKVYKKSKNWHDKPDDWETPNLHGQLSYLVLNPTWNVPQSIMREEIVYKMRKDSSYLSSHNFKVFLDTLELNPDSIKISDLMVEKVPYKIIQDPGAGNALGKIKFIFNNPFGIYLHDTPNRPPFKYDNRAVSHGCVRVENPLPLAEFLLREHPKWNFDFVKIEIGMKAANDSIAKDYVSKRESLRKYASLGETTDVALAKKIPLYIDYYTAWIDGNGVVNFRADVYNRDNVLIKYFTTNKLF